MRAKHVVSALLVLTAVVAVLWAVREGRLQEEESAAALGAEAVLLARSLGPSLAAASAATRELDEIETRRLIDNANHLARLATSGRLATPWLEEISERNELDAVLVLDSDGRPSISVGDPPSDRAFGQLGDVVRGEVELAVLGRIRELGVDHFAVAVAVPGGGAVLVTTHLAAGGSFARSIGVANLLRSVVREEGVLYLEYVELPSERRYFASWDGGPVPPRVTEGEPIETVRGRPVFETLVPVAVPAGLSATVRVGLDAAPLERASVAALRRTTLVGVVLTASGVALLGLALLVRLRTLEGRQARRRLEQAEAARLRGERLAAAGTLTAGLAHEVRSPLNAIALAAQRIGRRKEQSPECAEFARGIQGEVRRLEGVLRDFLQLAGPVGQRREPVELATLVGSVFDLLRAEAEQKGVALAPVSGDARAVVDAEAVRRCVINLTQNAIEASSSGGVVEATLGRDGDRAVLRVLDRGTGVDPELERRVFDAFFTTRAGGTGLGLSLTRRVMDEHGGECSLVPREGGGSVAELRFPAGPGNGETNDP